MNLSDLFNEYRPIKNHIDYTDDWSGCVYNLTNEQVEFIKAYDHHYVWSILDGYPHYSVMNGFFTGKKVIGYMITEVQSPNDILIVIDDEND